MKILIQRVKTASVTIENKLFSKIEKGMLIFLGIEKDDVEADMDWLINKIKNLRIFADEEDKMNYELQKILHKIFRQQYFKIYTFKKQILNYHPLVLKSSTGVEILDEDFETDSKYDFLLKTYIKKGKYLDILNEYISCN